MNLHAMYTAHEEEINQIIDERFQGRVTPKQLKEITEWFIKNENKKEAMKKVKQYKGFIIALGGDNYLHIFQKDEWSLGKGFRYEEHEAGSMQEAIDFIDSY